MDYSKTELKNNIEDSIDNFSSPNFLIRYLFYLLVCILKIYSLSYLFPESIHVKVPVDAVVGPKMADRSNDNEPWLAKRDEKKSLKASFTSFHKEKTIKTREHCLQW